MGTECHTCVYSVNKSSTRSCTQSKFSSTAFRPWEVPPITVSHLSHQRWVIRYDSTSGHPSLLLFLPFAINNNSSFCKYLGQCS